MRWTQLPLAAALAVLLAAAVSLAAPFADKAGSGGDGAPQLNPGQVAALARQLTNELAEAVAEAAGDTAQRAPATKEAVPASEASAAGEGGAGSTLVSGRETGKARTTRKSSGAELHVADKSLDGDSTRGDGEGLVGDPVRLTISLLIGDQPQVTELGLVRDESQATRAVVERDDIRIHDKALSTGRVMTSDTAAIVTNSPSVTDDRTILLSKLVKSEDPLMKKSITSIGALNGDTALVTDKAIENNKNLDYHKNLKSGNMLTSDKPSINKALEKEDMQVKNLPNNAQTLVCNNVPISFKCGQTGEIVVSGRHLTNANELASDKKLINKKEQVSDQKLVGVRGKMGNDEVVVTVETLVGNKDLSSVKTASTINVQNDDRKTLKEKSLLNGKGLESDNNLHDHKATENIKNQFSDEVTTDHNPTTCEHKDTTLLILSGGELNSKTSASSRTVANTLMTDDQSSASTFTPTTTTATSSVKLNTSPSLADLLTFTPTAIWVFTAHPLSSCQSTKATPENIKATSTLISTIQSKSTSKEQGFSSSSSGNNKLLNIGDKSSHGDALLVSEVYEDNMVSAEDEKEAEEGGRRIRRQNGEYDPEEIGRQLAVVLGRAANAQRVAEKDIRDLSGTESSDLSAEENSPQGSRRSRQGQGQEATEEKVAPAAGAMAPAKEIIAPVADAVQNAPSDSENVAASDEDSLDAVEERGSSNENMADRNANAKTMAIEAPLSSQTPWASRATDGWQAARSSAEEVTYHASTSDAPQPLRALEGMPGGQLPARGNEEDLDFNDAFEAKSRKDGRHSKKSSKVNVPWLIDADGDHIMLVPNDPSTPAKPPSDQRHPPRTESKTAATASDAPGWRHGARSSPGPDSKPALLSNLKKLEQELNRQRADSLGSSAEPEPKSLTLKVPVAVFDVKDSKDVILMVEGKGNATRRPMLTDAKKEKCEDEIQCMPCSPKPDIHAKQPTCIQKPKDAENCADDTFRTQDDTRKTEQEKCKCKPLDETSRSQSTRPKPGNEPQKTKPPGTPGVMLGKLTGKNNTTFVQRTLIETAVVPGPDGCLTANTAILMHQAFEQPAKAPEAKTCLSAKNKTNRTSVNTTCSPSAATAAAVAAPNCSKATRANATKSEPVCVARGRLAEMLPVGDGKGRKQGDGAIDLGAAGTLSGRPQVSNPGASGVLPPKPRGSKSDASSNDDEGDIVRGRPMSVAARARGGGGGDVATDVDVARRHRPKEPKTVGEADAIDLGVPGGLRGRPQVDTAGASGTLRVFKKIREKQKEDVADSEDASTAANVLSGVADASEQKRPVSGVVRSKGERSHARVQMAVPETGVLYGGDSGPEVVVTDGLAAVPRGEDAGGDPAPAADVGGDWARAPPSPKLPEEEEEAAVSAAVRERAGLGDNTPGPPSDADAARDAQLAEALGIQEASPGTGQPGSLLPTLGRWSGDEGAGAGAGAGTGTGTRSRHHKRPRPPPSLLVLPDDRLEMDVGVSLQRPQDDTEDTPR